MTDAKIFNGGDLLDKIFEFAAMTPDENQWNLSALNGNPPRHIRFRQIQSLSKAFFWPAINRNLFDKAKALFNDKESFSIHSILAGDFIKSRSLDDYTQLIDFIKDIVTEYEGSTFEQRPLHIMNLIMPYQQLIKYKRQLMKLLTFNSGVIEAGSFTTRFSLYLTDEVSTNLSGQYSKLDKALELFINPKGLTFGEDELIRSYKFPTDDLNQIDLDYV